MNDEVAESAELDPPVAAANRTQAVTARARELERTRRAFMGRRACKSVRVLGVETTRNARRDVAPVWRRLWVFVIAHGAVAGGGRRLTF